MNWSAFKQSVDEKLIEELGTGYDEDSVEIDFIDVGMFSEPSVEIIKNNDSVSIQVLD